MTIEGEDPSLWTTFQENTMKKRPSKAQTKRMNEEAHEAIARLASVDLGNPLEKIVARAAVKRQRLAIFLASELRLDQATVEAALLAFEEEEDAAFLAR